MRTSTLALVWAALLAMPVLAAAQEANGRIMGTVYDQQGATIPAVQITVTNTATQVARATTTDNDGQFQVLELPIGAYQVTARHQGFQTVVSDPQKLLIGQSLRVDLKMTVGATTQTVNVEATTAPIETVSSTLGQSVSSRALVNLPLNGRDVMDLALLQPGITESNDDNAGAGNFSIAGGRTDSITYLLDGGINNDLLDNSQVLNPNPDSVAEFRLLTSSYSAEFGRNGGGIISVVTKSGTNRFHGSAFDFIRNTAFNANSYFNIPEGLPREDLKRNQFGLTFGGPIVKDKLFFFAAYQGQRQVLDASVIEATVFQQDQLKGDFSKAAVDNNNNPVPDPAVAAFLRSNPYFQPDPSLAARAIIDPSKINNVAKAYMSNNLIPNSPSGLLSYQDNTIDNRDELTIKFDFTPNPKDRFSGTWGMNRNPQLNPGSIVGYSDRVQSWYYFFNLGYTRIITPSLLNDLHFVTHRSYYKSHIPARKLPLPSDLGIRVTPDEPTGPTNIYFNDSGFFLGPSENGPTRYVENTFSWTDTISWTHGTQNWKFGTGFSPYQQNLKYDFYINGEFDYAGDSSFASGNEFADFLLGMPYGYFQQAAAPSNIRSKSTYFFGQNEWHVRKNLVLTLGLRYEYNTPKSDTEGRLFFVMPGQRSKRFINAPVGLIYPGDSGAPWGTNFPDKNDFAPRFGFAWDPRGDGKMSLRGGFGVFYDILKGEDNLQYNGQPPFVGSASLFFDAPSQPITSELNLMSDPFTAAGVPNSFPSHPPVSDIDFSQFLPINGTYSVYVTDPHLRTPYIYQYNLSWQRELPASIVVEASYVGSSGHKLTSAVDVNPMILGTTDRVLNLTPGNDQNSFGPMPELRNLSRAHYNSLEASLTRQPKNSNLGANYFTLAYTYAHNLDNASGFEQRNYIVPFYEPQHFYASGDSDIRHRISFSGGWDLPFDRAWRANRLTKGWSLYPIVTWRTGFPFDIGARAPGRFDPTNPGPSGAGDPQLINAEQVAPIRYLDPRKKTTINVIDYFNSVGSDTCELVSYPVTGNFYLDPNSFSNALFYNTDGSNPCFPTFDPVNNPFQRTYGIPRNLLRGPHQTNVDLAITKTTPLKENISFEFRVEFFNIFNHPEFANPSTNVDRTFSTFGQVISTGSFRSSAARIIQLAARFSF